jgi:hypothetical protein
MKKCIISPLLSAFVIPGLGQLANAQIAKGAMILGTVTFLLIGILFKVATDVMEALDAFPDPQINPELFHKLFGIVSQQDHKATSLLTIAFVLVWVYSIIDAYINGKRMDRSHL